VLENNMNNLPRLLLLRDIFIFAPAPTESIATLRRVVSVPLPDKLLGSDDDEGEEGEEEDGGMFDFGKMQTQLTESLNSGYLMSTKSLRETLLAHEWEMSAKHTAQRR
jgi:hypothetical protein